MTATRMPEFYGPGSSIARSGDLQARLLILGKGVSRVHGVTPTGSTPSNPAISPSTGIRRGIDVWTVNREADGKRIDSARRNGRRFERQLQTHATKITVHGNGNARRTLHRTKSMAVPQHHRRTRDADITGGES